MRMQADEGCNSSEAQQTLKTLRELAASFELL
jgi:hypothetical protein